MPLNAMRFDPSVCGGAAGTPGQPPTVWALHDLARFVPDCVMTVRWLRRDTGVPRRAKAVVGLAGLWLLPNRPVAGVLPVIGPLDDGLVVTLALRYPARQVPATCWSPPGPVSRGCWRGCSAAPGDRRAQRSRGWRPSR